MRVRTPSRREDPVEDAAGRGRASPPGSSAQALGGGVLHCDTRCYNRLLTALRAPTERAHALLGYWRALGRITVCPRRIGPITAAALVLLHREYGRTT
jgi:hypothetical protein